jgi:hypothetical protein
MARRRLYLFQQLCRFQGRLLKMGTTQRADNHYTPMPVNAEMRALRCTRLCICLKLHMAHTVNCKLLGSTFVLPCAAVCCRVRARVKMYPLCSTGVSVCAVYRVPCTVCRVSCVVCRVCVCICAKACECEADVQVFAYFVASACVVVLSCLCMHICEYASAQI